MIGFDADDEERQRLEGIPEEKAELELPEAHGGLDLENEVISIPTTCPACGAPAQANFKQVNIPFFKEIIIMANLCDECGEKSNEIKAGMGFEPFGEKLILNLNGNKQGNIEHKCDLARDVLISDNRRLGSQEFDFEMGR